MNFRYAFIFAALLLALACSEKKPATVIPVGPSPADMAKVEFERKLDSPKIEERLEVLNQTLMAWMMVKGAPPASVEEFVTAGMLPRLPVAPDGSRFVIASAPFRVVLAPR